MNESNCRPAFSVVITTEHEEDSLLALIKAVVDQSTPEMPVEILVTDYSLESRQEAVKALARNTQVPIRYFRLPSGKPFAARNRGIREADGHMIAFTDDDCIPPAGWLATYREAFRDPSVGAAGGPDKAPGSAKPFLQALDYVLTSFAGTAGMRGSGRRSAAYYPRTWNMAVSRRALDAAGSFDESLPGAQEFDLALRIRDAGHSIVCLPDCIVEHRRDTNIVGLFRSGYRSSLGRSYIARIRPGTGKLVHAIPAVGGLGSLGLMAISPMIPATATLAAGSLLLYMALLAVSGAHAAVSFRRPRMLALVPITMITQHVSHALGFALGCTLGLMRGRRRLNRYG